jgi:Icc-related predicted phosphoesterase
MRILAISDIESKYYYDYYKPGKLDEFDLILACGDLSRTYLEFIISMAHCPVLYVRGNHDDLFGTEPPEGCVCIEDRIFLYQGIRILGLGGSHRYRDGDNMFTEREMEGRIRRLWRQMRKYQGFDILVTHAPARHINDFESVAHRGFECFVTLLDKYQPKYFVHGHIHKNYGMHIPQKTERGNTTIINAYDHCAFDY